MKFSKILGQELVLSNGIKLKNRFMKSAMSEVLGSKKYAPTNAHEQLYRTWAQGGTGLLITGNVMVDSQYIGELGNVVIENETTLPQLQNWSSAGTENNTHLWMQINHPGKQIPSFLAKQPVAPSAIPLKLPLFNKPRELTGDEISEIIHRFATVAAIAKKANFTGVQIHGAHGYLVSQFLSSYHNQRKDSWGGNLENRMRFLLEIYQSIRHAVGEEFPIALKVNSADFQRGGFTEQESLQVIKEIASLGINLIEISGGTYEAPVMIGTKQKQSTQQREAYFLEFASQVRKEIDTPLAVTGGFRTANGMAEAINSGHVDLVGLARPLAVDPNLPQKILQGESFQNQIPQELKTGIKAIDKLNMVGLIWYEHQIALMGRGKPPNPNMSVWSALLKTICKTGWKNLHRRRSR